MQWGLLAVGLLASFLAAIYGVSLLTDHLEPVRKNVLPLRQQVPRGTFQCSSRWGAVEVTDIKETSRLVRAYVDEYAFGCNPLLLKDCLPAYSLPELEALLLKRNDRQFVPCK